MAGTPQGVAVLPCVSITLLYLLLVHYCPHDIPWCSLSVCVPIYTECLGMGTAPTTQGTRVDTGIPVEGLSPEISWDQVGIQTPCFIYCVIWGKLFAFALLSLVHKQHNFDKVL